MLYLCAHSVATQAASLYCWSAGADEIRLLKAFPGTPLLILPGTTEKSTRVLCEDQECDSALTADRLCLISVGHNQRTSVAGLEDCEAQGNVLAVTREGGGYIALNADPDDVCENLVVAQISFD